MLFLTYLVYYYRFRSVEATGFLTFLFPVAPAAGLVPSGATGFLTFSFSVAHQSVLPVGATIILFYKKEYFYQTAYINIFSDGFASALLT